MRAVPSAVWPCSMAQCTVRNLLRGNAFRVPHLLALSHDLHAYFLYGLKNSREQIAVFRLTHHLVMMPDDGYFGLIGAMFMADNHVRLPLPLSGVEKIRDLLKFGFQFNGLRRVQRHVAPRVSDFHVDYSRTRRWCVDGIFRSSRYFATVRRVT